MAADGTDSWLTVACHLRSCPWADDNHEVAFAQIQLRSSNTQPTTVCELLRPFVQDRHVLLGPATFDCDTGALLSIGDSKVSLAQIDLWRAPTDNDKGGAMSENWPEVRTSNLDSWLEAGLDRVQHQVNAVVLHSNQLVVTSQVGPAVLDRYLEVKTAFMAPDPKTLSVGISILPKGPWSNLELPRLGFQLQLDSSAYESVRWHGYGPGEAYPDTRSGVRLGVYESTIDNMQTPYITPQENGTRLDVRYARLLDNTGRGLCFVGQPSFGFAVRRWSTESLATATRQTELTASNRLFVHIDHAVSGVGSASTGPGVQSPYIVKLVEGQSVHFAFDIQVIE